MLSFVLGRSGTGKTFFLYEEMKKRAAAGEEIILLVPKQFSYESESLVYHKLGAELGTKVSVLSFSRLCEKVFWGFGQRRKNPLSDSGRAIILSLALEEISGELKFYKRSKNYSGFLDKILDILTQLKRSGASTDELADILARIDNKTLGSKFSEILTILLAYDSYLKRGFIDTEDDLSVCISVLRDKNFFAGKTIFVDEFKSFSAVERDVLAQMIGESRDFYITLCTGGKESGEDESLGVFRNIKKEMERLKTLAKELGVGLAPVVVLEENKRLIHSDLRLLEAALSGEEGISAEKEKAENIRIFRAKNPYGEAAFVAAEISRLVRDEGYRYKDIAVLSRGIMAYENCFETMFARYDIPYFYSKQTPIYHRPLAAFLRHILASANRSFDSESILAALKTGVLQVSEADIALLENYVYLWGIKGMLWQADFTANPSGFKADFSQKDIENLAAINSVREKIIEPILKIRELPEYLSGEEFCREIFEMLKETGVEEKLKEDIKNEDEKTARDNIRRIWDVLVDILDDFAVVLGHVKLSRTKLSDMMDLMIEKTFLADIPQMIDQVLVCDSSLVRASTIKIVFALGCTEGVFPLEVENQTILSNAERTKLISLGLALTDTLDDMACAEDFIAYKTASLAGEKLYLTYPTYDIGGKSLYPSSLLLKIQNLFVDFDEETEMELGGEFFIQNWASLKYSFAREYQKKGDSLATLRHMLEADEERFLQNFDSIYESLPFIIENKQLANTLFAASGRFSPSGMERYFSCPFSYFANYGLRLRKPQRAELSPLVIGNLLHYALQYLMQKYDIRGLAALPIAELEAELVLVFDKYMEEFLGGKDEKTRRFSYLYKRLLRTVRDIVLQLGEEFSQSKFVPSDFELRVGEGGVAPLEIELPTGEKAFVEGIIDRVDIYESRGKKYIRIVDYKTGAKKIALSDFYYGLNLQMLLYLFSIWKNGEGKYEGALPAGVLYYPARGTYIDMDREAPEEALFKEKQKTYKMHGFVLDDPDILEAMEEGAAGIFIPAKLDKDGNVKGDKSGEGALSLAEIGKLYTFANGLIEQMVTELKGGVIKAVPIKRSEDSTACKYCDYRAICGHEMDGEFKDIVEFSKAELFEKIGEGAALGGD